MFRKKIFVLMGVILLMCGCSDSTKTKEISYDGNLIVNRVDDFREGENENTKINDEGEIILEDSSLQGKYISPIMATEKFNELVASWNVDTPEETEIELFVKAKIEDQWTMWFSYGKWSQEGTRGSIEDQIDKTAKMSIDTLEILWGKDADAIRYSVELTRKDSSVPSPKIRNIFLALKPRDEVEKVSALDKDYLIELNVPERSQMVVPEIGNVICSPTSVSMVLEYYGYDIDAEEVAENVLDKKENIYGNWSFNAAYGGTKCKYSYVARFTSINDIKEKISKGIPVIASIKTKSENTLIGAPQTYPSGHLLVVRGFTVKDGEEYVIVNDPAAPEVDTVRREYKVSGFEKAWNKIVYILSPELN
ncbi:peptidase C39 family protein [uncultured Tissierella sp.]|uniref:peptidase C39 family protein n=1 Tax=uncultured Tissierella sp. TaxID=448160 RepID=UPI0028049AF5|nr:peptidase C39 family protein [uncultured Tissierella sp.]MDU5081097.1 peptidase C39 family protein [Bacillota bacterium]